MMKGKAKDVTLQRRRRRRRRRRRLEDKASNEHNEHKEASKPKVLSGAAGQDNAAGIVSYY